MAGEVISVIGAVILAITAGYDFYKSSTRSEILDLQLSDIETSDGEIDRSRLPAIGSSRDSSDEVNRLILAGYLLALSFEVVGFLLFMEVI